MIFLHHQLQIKTNTGAVHSIGLEGFSVADFYEKVLSLLQDLGIRVKINPIPNELVDPIPFYKDHVHSTYNPRQAEDLHKALLYSNEVFTRFRAAFNGKCSPVHFFWGSFDLAVSRFSGRNAPSHPGGVPNLPDWVAQEAYCKEVCSSGFWPGNEAVPFAAFYTYIYPEPEGYKDASVGPEQAYYHEELREFILPYEAVQKAENPSSVLLDFLHSTYNAAADLAHWDRESLEKNLFKEKTEKGYHTYKQVDKI